MSKGYAHLIKVAEEVASVRGAADPSVNKSFHGIRVTAFIANVFSGGDSKRSLLAALFEPAVSEGHLSVKHGLRVWHRDITEHFRKRKWWFSIVFSELIHQVETPLLIVAS